MLSIAIPVYNYTITGLVHTLLDQAGKSGVPFEIIIMDDASEQGFRTQNRPLARKPHVVYTELEKNTGRSIIRNLLAQRARYDNILFLDCDSAVQHDDYIGRYIKRSAQFEVIHGGRKFDLPRPEKPGYMLHWLYSREFEWVDARTRQSNPVRHFKTNNFLIRKNLFSQITFNEDLKEYGHEDTLFGYELSGKNIVIDQIDNPVYHTGIKSTGEFMKNTRESFVNLKQLLESGLFDDRGMEIMGLAHVHRQTRNRLFIKTMTLFFTLFERAMQKNLQSEKPSLFVFNLYKLGYFCSLY